MDLSAIFKVTYGIYVVTASHQGRSNAFLANTLCQVNSEPPSFQVIVSKKNFTHDLIRDSGLFVASVITEDAPLSFVGGFGFKSGRDTDKLSGVKTMPGPDGVPVVTDFAAAWLACRVFQTVDAGTHTIFIGNLADCETLSDARPMTYAYYREVKKGTTAKNAPTYVDPQKTHKL